MRGDSDSGGIVSVSDVCNDVVVVVMSMVGRWWKGRNAAAAVAASILSKQIARIERADNIMMEQHNVRQ
jgi:hypothetical protein